MGRRASPRWRWLLRAALAASLAFAPSGSIAQAAADEAPPEPVQEAPLDPSQPLGPRDEYNRGTPRGSMYGFLSASRKGDFDRAAQYLDLRRLPTDEQTRGPELARQLKVILDQTLWVDTANLSAVNAGTTGDGLPQWQDRVGEIETSGGPVDILLQRVPREGDEVRIWKMAARTVEQIPVLYGEFEPVWLEEQLPSFFTEIHLFGVALWKWVALLAALAAALFVAFLIAGITTRIAGAVFTRGRSGFDPRIIELVRGPVRLALTVVLFAFGHRNLGLGLELAAALRYFERILFAVAVAWLAFRLIDLAALTLRLRAERRGNVAVFPVLLPGARFAKIVVFSIGALGVLGTMGVNVSAAVAGLGVGGIAIALAAQKTLENLFGGITLFADRPVRVGDFFRYGTDVGTVEEIGLRSTRIRTLDRTVVSIPNREFSDLRLENFARRDQMRLFTTIGVRYETTPEQLRFLLTGLREILLEHPRVTEDPARVRFVGFGAYSLDIEIFAYVDTADWGEFLGIREDLYLRIMDAVAAAGTGFAFPSSTMYLGRDEGLPDDDARRAEEQVRDWRERGELPFPGIPEERRSEIWNRGDWPPEGSPGSEDPSGRRGR